MIVKCLPKHGAYETEDVKAEKLVMLTFNVVSCDIISETAKLVTPETEGKVDTILLVRTKEEGSYRFNLNDYHNIYLISEDGKIVDRFKPE